MGLNENEFYNSHKVLDIFKEIGEYSICKNEVFDYFLNKKVYIYYLKFGDNNFQINKERFELLKEYGVKEKII